MLGWSVSIRAASFTIMKKSINRTATTTETVYTCSTDRRTCLFEVESLQSNCISLVPPISKLRSYFYVLIPISSTRGVQCSVPEN